jgi:Ran-binding protein 9/10
VRATRHSSAISVLTILTIGSVFDNVGKDVELFPSVGLRHSGEAVRVNFGHEPFKYDIDYHVQQARNHTWANILRTPLNSSLLARLSKGQDSNGKRDSTVSSTKTTLTDEQTKNTINKLVMAYLAHHGYIKTVRAFQKQEKIFCGEATQVAETSSEDLDIDMGERSECGDLEYDIERRSNIVDSVISGDIDTALADTRAHYPSVLAAEEGLMLFKLRCRKFVELILEASELKKKMKSHVQDEELIEEMDGIYEDGMGMDVDDEDDDGVSMNMFGSSTSVPLARGGKGASLPTEDDMWPGSTASQYETALNEAITYGQTLSNDYKADTRPQVKEIFKRTFAIVAWEDPMMAGGVVTEVVGHEASVALATELNQAILSEYSLSYIWWMLIVLYIESQGRPPQPTLETLYRHTAASIVQLGLLGVGSAAFADMPKEFLSE